MNQRVKFLSAYQNKRYAERYRQFVSQVQQREEALLGKDTLSKSVARNLFKLMAYKDEYEVARLHSDPAFMGRITEQFEGDFTVNFHLAPPLLAKRNTEGQLLKSKFGQRTLIAFRMLARMKGLRGTWFDIFARTEERKSERALIDDYRSTIEELLPDLNASNYGLAKEIAELPSLIRGYGHVKERNLVATRAKSQDLLGQWRMPAAKQATA